MEKTPARPALLTLTGIYSTSKNVYATYMPATAIDVIQNIAEKLITVTAPTLMTVLPDEKEPAKDTTDSTTVPDLAKLDSLLIEAFQSGDTKIDMLISDSTAKVVGAYASMKTAASDKVTAVKTRIVGKVEEAKTFVDEKVETVKAAVSRKMEDENIAAMKSRAELYYTTAKDNVEPAKIVLGNIAANAKAGITEKGYIGFAQVAADVLKDKGLEKIEVLKVKGPVEGVKEIAGEVVLAVKSALDDAKEVVSECETVEVELNEVDEDATAEEDTAFDDAKDVE